MKKLISLLAAASIALSASADEGMWLLPYLKKMNIKQMKSLGCKLSAEEIYSLDRSSLKDAIVVFGGGCTGEIVSPEGLLFTNHHCGYASIQSLSSVDHDYLKYGFWARDNAEEIPAPGLKVRFVRRIFDVTAEVVGNVPSIAGQKEYEEITRANIAALTERLEKEHPGMRIEVKPFFEGNQFFAFVMEVYSDVRLVGTPPSSIGKFGGDTDNWMWPRHTGDFSVFRVYAGPDNRPAEYSPENRPYKAEKYLKISLGGVRENDFAMIMGFPGSTQRFATSYELGDMLAVSNPQRIFIRGERQEILWKDMLASDAVRIQYASKYARSSNYWKNSIGMSRGIEKLNVKAQKQAQEAAFQKWAEANTLPEEGFIEALPMMKEAVDNLTPKEGAMQYLSEALLRGVELLTPPQMLGRGDMSGFYKDYEADLDRKVAKRMLAIVRQNMNPDYLPSIYAEVIDKKFCGDTDAYVDWLYDTSVFTSLDKLNAATDEQKNADPALELSKSVIAAYREAGSGIAEWNRQFNRAHRLYIAGLMRMQPDKAWASDANFSIRLTYGNVLPYNPADGITYNYFTTLEGVIAKEDTSNPLEFTVEEKLKELYRAKDYGRYADADGRLRVGFLANLDITGGNSGSPVLDGNGRLIGLAFDGNWEAMSGDVAFEPDLQRCIAVDVRYVLFVIDKFAGCDHIMNELDIVQSKALPLRKKKQ